MEVNHKEQCSKMFAIGRVFALVSIVCAHIVVQNEIVGRIYSILASFGAATFFIISGYYYKPEHYTSFGGMLKKKAVSVVVPWLFLGTIGYLYNLIASKSAFSIVSLLLWLIGYKTYLYFLTFLMLFYLVFYKTNTIVLIGALVLNCLSYYLTHYGIINGIHSSLLFTNRIGFFALGMLLRDRGDRFTYELSKNLRIVGIVFIVFAISSNLLLPDLTSTIIGIVYPVYMFLGCFTCFGLATFKCFHNKVFFYVSSISFTVFLIHFMCIGVIDSLYSSFVVTQLFSAFLVIGICAIGIYVLREGLRLLHWESLNILFGFRKMKS